MFIGFITRQKLQKLEREGDVSPFQVKKFMEGIRVYYENAVEFIVNKFPIDDETLKHAQFVHFENREVAEFTDVSYFVDEHSSLLNFSSQQLDQLYEEFVEYQLQKSNKVMMMMSSLHVYAYTYGYTLGFYQQDEVSNLAQLVLILPHSNACEERVFRLVRLNKTT